MFNVGCNMNIFNLTYDTTIIFADYFNWAVHIEPFYRPQRSCGQGNVFTGVCLSTGGRVSASVHAGMPDPPPGTRQTPPRDQADTPRTRQTPPDQADPPGPGRPPSRTRQTPQDQADPPGLGRPPPDQADTPPGPGRHPRPPPKDSSIRAAGTHATGMHSCASNKITFTLLITYQVNFPFLSSTSVTRSLLAIQIYLPLMLIYLSKNLIGWSLIKAPRSLTPTLNGFRSSSCRCMCICRRKSVSMARHNGCSKCYNALKQLLPPANEVAGR